jgi:single-stranded-DNA-specific exonuclease
MPEIERRQPVAGAESWNWPPKLHPVLRRILSCRDIGSPSELLLTLSELRPVGEFDALQNAVDLLCEHKDGRILIVGDFDADGATSTSLVYLCLRDLGFADVDFFIPDRFELGYGLSPGVIERVASRAPTLILTVDNGVSSIDGVAAARSAGMDVLITDHHLPGEELPNANVIVNPNLRDDSFAGKHLAGVGVAFYLLAALERRLGYVGRVVNYLDLVALGTIADLVKLDHSNRILVDEGLRRIRAGRCRPGIRALCQVSAVDIRDVSGTTLGYQVAPRLNAAGRLDDMTVGVRCLTCDSDTDALEYATKLDSLNRERRTIEAKMKAEALEIVDAEELLDTGQLPTIVCLHREDWHQGIVGLVASRIKDRYHRPVFAFASTESGTLKGSGRSVAGFHLRDALADVDAANPGLIDRFGGHAMAAGLSLDQQGLATFESEMQRIGDERLLPEHLAQRILTDGELAPEDLNLEVAQLLSGAGPWGQGFPEPLFDGRFELVRQRVVGERHLKMTVRPVDAELRLEAIAFNCPPGDRLVGQAFRLVYRLGINDYFAGPPIQLIVEHIEGGKQAVSR